MCWSVCAYTSATAALVPWAGSQLLFVWPSGTSWRQRGSFSVFSRLFVSDIERLQSSVIAWSIGLQFLELQRRSLVNCYCCYWYFILLCTVILSNAAVLTITTTAAADITISTICNEQRAASKSSQQQDEDKTVLLPRCALTFVTAGFSHEISLGWGILYLNSMYDFALADGSLAGGCCCWIASRWSLD